MDHSINVTGGQKSEQVLFGQITVPVLSTLNTKLMF